MRPNLIAMEIKISNQVRTYLASSLYIIIIKRNGVRRNNTYENDNPSTKVITGKTAKALNELVRTTSIL